MEKRTLFKSIKVQAGENGGEINLRYYVTSTYRGGKFPIGKTYGISIVKNTDDMPFEEITVNNIFFDRATADSFVAMLCDNSVTPVSVTDILSDFMFDDGCRKRNECIPLSNC